jgi:hypothetical protein
MIDNNAIPNAPFSHAITNCRNRSCRFMPENPRRSNQAIMNFLQVCAADAARRHAHQNLALANVGNGNGLNAHIIFAAIHGGTHGLGKHCQQNSLWKGNVLEEIIARGRRKKVNSRRSADASRLEGGILYFMNTPKPRPQQPVSRQNARSAPQPQPHHLCRVCGTAFLTRSAHCPACRTPAGLRANPDDPTMTTYLP